MGAVDETETKEEDGMNEWEEKEKEGGTMNFIRFVCCIDIIY